MFKLRKPKQPPVPVLPVVSHSYGYRVKFCATLPREHAAVRYCLDIAVLRLPQLKAARITAWDGHAVTAEVTVTVPWTSRDHRQEADRAVTHLLKNLPVGGRIIYLARLGAAPQATETHGELTDHPGLAELDAHCLAYYGERLD